MYYFNQKRNSNISQQRLLGSLESGIYNSDQLSIAKEIEWHKYKNERKPQSLKELKRCRIDFHGKTMKYFCTTIGKPSPTGYALFIALHGGGSSDKPDMNDSQWKHMQYYYRAANTIKQGIYVAPRGVTDTWDLHSVPEAFPMYDSIIENMILFRNVDPNQVYICGFSAGGDGVYQITNRMPDKWAAANMSAGHPNGIPIINLHNISMQLQVGDHDEAYNRNRVTAEYDLLLKNAHKFHPYSYKHNTYIHYGQPHNFPDNVSPEFQFLVYESPQGWYTNTNIKVSPVNPNVPCWLQSHVRNPYPTHIQWSTTNNAPLRGLKNNFHYWLEITEKTTSTLIEASYDRNTNRIDISKAGGYLKIHFNDRMLQIHKPIEIHINQQKLSTDLIPSIRNIVDSIRVRSDPNYIFECNVGLVENKNGEWVIEE